MEQRVPLCSRPAANKMIWKERKALFFLSIHIRSFEMMCTMFFHLLQIGATCRCTIDRWRLRLASPFSMFFTVEPCATLDSIAGNTSYRFLWQYTLRYMDGGDPYHLYVLRLMFVSVCDVWRVERVCYIL